jgi:hypothetical protein
VRTIGAFWRAGVDIHANVALRRVKRGSERTQKWAFVLRRCRTITKAPVPRPTTMIRTGAPCWCWLRQSRMLTAAFTGPLSHDPPRSNVAVTSTTRKMHAPCTALSACNQDHCCRRQRTNRTLRLLSELLSSVMIAAEGIKSIDQPTSSGRVVADRPGVDEVFWVLCVGSWEGPHPKVQTSKESFVAEVLSEAVCAKDTLSRRLYVAIPQDEFGEIHV